jgi:hypothetical protein
MPGFFHFKGGILKFTKATTEHQWRRIGIALGKQHNAVRFDLGDWLRFGQMGLRVRGVYDIATELTGLSIGTLMNYVSVAKHYKPHERVAGVPFSHHQLVAWLPKDVRASLLRQAKAGKWSWDVLRERASISSRQQKSNDNRSRLLMAHLPQRLLNDLHSAASHLECTVSEVLIDVLDDYLPTLLKKKRRTA